MEYWNIPCQNNTFQDHSRGTTQKNGSFGRTPTSEHLQTFVIGCSEKRQEQETASRTKVWVTKLIEGVVPMGKDQD